MDYYKKNQEYLPKLNSATDIVLSRLFWSYEKFMKNGAVYQVKEKRTGAKSIFGLDKSNRGIPKYSTIGDWLEEYNYYDESDISKYRAVLSHETSDYLEGVYKQKVDNWSPELHKELELAREEFNNHISSLDIKRLEDRRIIE